MLDTSIKLIMSILSIVGLVILTFSIFKIPIKKNDKQIAILGLLLGTINFYTKFILNSPIQLFIFLILFIVLLMVLRSYPILYSTVVCATGIIAAAIFDAIVSFGSIYLKLTTVDLMQTSLLHFSILHILVTIFYLFFATILVRLNIGFSFVIRRFKGRHSLKLHNFIWAMILILGISFGQIIIQHLDVLSFHGIAILGLSVVLMVILIYSYIQNKKSLRDRYEKQI